MDHFGVDAAAIREFFTSSPFRCKGGALSQWPWSHSGAAWCISSVIFHTEYAEQCLGWLRRPRPGALKFDEFDQFCAHAFLNARLQAHPARPTPPKADRGGTL